MKARTRRQPIRVIIADDHPAIREGLAAILRSQNDIEVVAEATDGEEACQLYDELSPDVLLLDLRMPKKDALLAVIELMSSPRVPKPGIIVMATYEEEEDIHRTLSAGARGYVLKAAPPEYIRRAVRRAAGRESLLSSGNWGAPTSAAGSEAAPGPDDGEFHIAGAEAKGEELTPELPIVMAQMRALRRLHDQGQAFGLAIASGQKRNEAS
jgi:DNA-binding NarL/FixJ family response regulator